MVLPVAMHVKESGLHLTFAEPIAPDSVKPENISIKSWSLKRSKKYGSDHLNEKMLKVSSADVLKDGKTVLIAVDELMPTWCMEVKFAFQTISGTPTEGVIHNTIHSVQQE